MIQLINIASAFAVGLLSLKINRMQYQWIVVAVNINFIGK